MKTAKKKLVKAKPQRFTKTELSKAILDQKHFALQVKLTEVLLELYDRKPNDFKLMVGQDFLNRWKVSDPYTRIDHFVEFCDEVAMSVIDYYHNDGQYPILLRNDEHAFIGLTKNKKKMTPVDRLLDFIDLVDHSGVSNATITLVEEGKL